MIPQYLILAITILGLGIAMERHGKEKKGKENIWITILSNIILLSLLWWGGFFKGMF